MANIFKPVKISNKAIERIKSIMETKKVPSDYFLRIGIQGTGCVGNTHTLAFDKKRDRDLELHEEGLNIIIAKKELMYIVGFELDYIQQDDQQGFIFKII